MLVIILSVTANGLPFGGEAGIGASLRFHEGASDDLKAEVVRAASTTEDLNLSTTVRPKGGETPPFTPLWGTDVLIRDADNGNPYGLAMDVADDGEIFVAVLMKVPGYRNDTLEVWRSADGGASWVRDTVMDVFGEIDPQGMDIAVGPGSNPWVYVAVNWDDSSTSTIGQGLYFRRIRRDHSAYDWYGIVTEDTVDRPRISVNNSNTLVITYLTDNGRVYRGVSSDSGGTWDISFANLNTTWAEIYVSDNGRGYHAYVKGDTNVLVVTFNAPSSSADNVTVLALPDTVRQVSITASGGTSSSQEATVVWANRHPSTDVWDVHYSVSTDGGATWQSPNAFPATNFPYGSGNYMNYPYVHRDRNSGSFRFVVTFVSSWDTVFYTHSSSVAGWTSASLIPINDHSATTTFGAVVDYSSNTGGGCVAYRQFASDRVWFDGYLFTDTKEMVEGRSKGVINVKGGIVARTTVKVYDAVGKLVASGSGFIQLGRGVYFVKEAGETYRVLVR